MIVVRPGSSRDPIMAELETVRRMHQLHHQVRRADCIAFRDAERRLLKLDADRRRS